MDSASIIGRFIDAKINRKLVTTRRHRPVNIHIPDHDQTKELVIGGGEADVSHTLISTSMNFTPPSS